MLNSEARDFQGIMLQNYQSVFTITETRRMKKTNNDSPIEELLVKMGNPGRYQLFVFFILCSNMFPISFHTNMMIFFGVVPHHHCKISHSLSINQSATNDQDECTININSMGHVSCPHGWDYKLGDHIWSIVPEWNLVCEKKYLVTLSSTLFFMGVAVSCLFVGALADHVGRKPILLVSLYGQLFLSVAIAFANSYWVFTILRFFLGICIQALTILTWTLTVELLPSHLRISFGLVLGIVWSLALGLQTWIALKMSTWRHVQLALSLPGIVTFVYVWFLPESIRWLLMRKKAETALNVAMKFMRFNRIEISKEFIKSIHEICNINDNTPSPHIQNHNKCGLKILFQTRKLTLVTCINFPCWFSSMLLYYGVAQLLSDLQENFYINVIIGAMTEILGLVWLLPSMNRLGRRFTLVFSLVVGGILFAALTVLSSVWETSKDQTQMVIAVLAKVMANNAFNCLGIYGNELFPTIVRSQGIALSAFWGRVGGMVSPQLSYLGHVIWTPLPFLIVSIFAITSGVLAYFLPETLNKPLPESIEDVEKLWTVPANQGSSVLQCTPAIKNATNSSKFESA